MRYLKISLNRIIKKPLNAVYCVLKVALATLIPTLFISVVFSFSGEAFVEIEKIWFLLRIYTADKSNAIYRMCSAITAITIIVGVVIMLVFAIKETLKRRKEFKNYLLIGASYFQVMTISLVENLIILVAGLGLGLLASWGVGAIIGICYSINIFINMSTFLIVSLIYFSISAITSVVVPVWINTSVK